MNTGTYRAQAAGKIGRNGGVASCNFCFRFASINSQLSTINFPMRFLHCNPSAFFEAQRMKLLIALVGCMAAAASSAAADAIKPVRPNILICIADDWSWPHASAYGDPTVRTPAFDRVAREGALFQNAFCASPSCSPSRAALLTGRAVHQLDEGGNLWGFLPSRFETFPDALARAGYHVGHMGKGWGPGNFQAGGRKSNPAGPVFKSLEGFLEKKTTEQPFCFWFGSQDPHRPYDRGAGARAGLKTNQVSVPRFWPDTPQVRHDILDYYFEVERWDRAVAQLLRLLEDRGELDNTIVIITSDNGWPFPRSKANLYDAGTHVPLAIRWPKKIKPGRFESFVNLQDIAPTVLEAAGVASAADTVGRSLLPLVTNQEQDGRRAMVFLERERHANVRRGDLSYPSRAVRSKDFLYIRNLRPERWPAGDPVMWKAVGEFGDCDAGIVKEVILGQRDEPVMKPFFDLCFGLRPEEELYDLRKDPGQTNNLAGSPDLSGPQNLLRQELDSWRRRTSDPRLNPADDRFEKAPYFGNANRMPSKAPLP
jgi:N-sulfoglucosamine sulfohydrolase